MFVVVVLREPKLTIAKPENLVAAADRCAKELGGIDFVM